MTSETAAKKIDAPRVLSWVPLQPHHHVADIGCGGGHFTVPLAKRVWDGKVYAIDVASEKLEAARETLIAARLSNFVGMLSHGEKLPLGDNSIDGAFLSRTLHHVENPRAMLKEAMRCVRKMGWLVLVELYKKEMEGTHPVDELLDEADVRGMAEELGFRLKSRHDVNNRYYVMVMRK